MNILNNGRRYLIIVLFITFNFTQAQGEFAIIEKNVNVLAEGLYHDLNQTKDTLILSSPAKIYRVYTVGTNKGAVDQELLTNNFEVPLSSFKRGKYVFIVDQLRYKIVFTVFVLKGQDLMPGEFLYDTEVAANMNEENDLKDEAINETRSLLKETTKLSNTTDVITTSTKKNERNSEHVFETFDLLKDAAKLTSVKEINRSKLKTPDTKKIRPDKLAQADKISLRTEKLKTPDTKKVRPDKLPPSDKISQRTKKLKVPLKNPNFYNLTDLNRNGVQSRADARKIMAVKRQKIRDSIKNLIKNQ